VAGVKPAAKILRVLGPKDDGAWERALIGIYDYLDGLTTVAFRQGVTIETPIVDVAAYTTIQTVGLGTFPKRRVANFAGPFLISDNLANARTDIDIGLVGPFIKGLAPATGGVASDHYLAADGTWTVPAGGINQLTGDVTAGPGTGSQVATIAAHAVSNGKLAQMPTLTIKGNNTGGTADPLDLTVAQVNAILPAFTSSLKGLTPSSGGGTTNFLRADGSWAAPAGGGITQLTGDVTAGPGSGSVVATLAQIPSDTPMLGDLLATAMASPGAPVAGKGRIYFDSTSLNLAAKGTGGVVNHGVQTRTATASNWIRSIADDGSSTISQPAFTDISGSVTLAQLGSGAALSVLGQPANSAGTRSDIATTSGTGQALRESGGTIGWGTLATAAYGNSTVTYPKIQNVTGNSLLGRGSTGTGDVQELSVSGPASFTASTFKVGKQYSLTWGGQNIQSGTVGAASFYIGLGSFDFSTSAFGYKAPNDSTLQDWSVVVMSNSLVASGATTYSVQFVLNGTPISTLFSTTIGSTGGTTVQTTQPLNAGDIIEVRISVNSGVISSGAIGLYVVGRFQE
jgi:hypothetical protein